MLRMNETSKTENENNDQSFKKSDHLTYKVTVLLSNGLLLKTFFLFNNVQKFWYEYLDVANFNFNRIVIVEL